MIVIKRALISVSDKTGIVTFASALIKAGVEIISTGGTAKLLAEANILVTEVADYTGFPELMEGRLKTLHPRIHGGILGRRGVDDMAMAAHNILPIDLVVVNLYPFAAQIARPDCTLAQAIENIDIGGPTMLRAAAKNHAAVTVVVDPADYPRVIEEMHHQNGAVGANLRFDLAVKAFEYSARYDGAIANYLGSIIEGEGVENPTYAIPLTGEGAFCPPPLLSGGGGQGGGVNSSNFPRTLNLQFTKNQSLRYGENPHQQAAFYSETPQVLTSVTTAHQIQGKELSYNNIADTDAALECLKQFPPNPTCVIVKHANPCGVAVGATLFDAYDRAYKTDPESAFGGIIACNGILDEVCTRAIVDRQFVEVIIAPDVSPEARAILATKPNLRVLICGVIPALLNTPLSCQGEGGQGGGVNSLPPRLDYKRVTGGMLVQEADLLLHAKLELVTQRAPTATEQRDLLFAWKVAKFVKSNAIVYARDLMTIGIGAGQMSRVNSARIATIKAEQAGLSTQGAVLASDAFFPFRDGLDQAAQAGITAVIQPGGSMRDAEVIDAANTHDIAMIFTGMRHFRH